MERWRLEYNRGQQEVTQEPVVMILTHSYPFQNKHSAFKKRGASSEFSITVV